MEIDTLIKELKKIKEEFGECNVFYDEIGEENGLFFVDMSSGQRHNKLIVLAGDIDEPYGKQPGVITLKDNE